MIAAGPELLYLSDYYNDVGLICKQARALGYTGFFLGGDGWDSADLVKIGGDAVEGGFFTNHFSKDDTRPEVQAFVKDYTAKFGAPPDCVSCSGLRRGQPDVRRHQPSEVHRRHGDPGRPQG